MPARVLEGAERAVRPAHDEDGHSRDLHPEARARVRELALVRHDDRHVCEEVRALGEEALLRRVRRRRHVADGAVASDRRIVEARDDLPHQGDEVRVVHCYYFVYEIFISYAR